MNRRNRSLGAVHARATSRSASAPVHTSSRKPLALALVAALGLAPLAASAATISVTSPGDTSVTSTSTCTLRQAIVSMNAGAVAGTGCSASGNFGSNDTITFDTTTFPTDGSGTITLADAATSQLAVTATDLTIDATANSQVTIQRAASASNDFRILYDSAFTGASLSLSHLTLQNGKATATDYCGQYGAGGGICIPYADLSLTNSTVRDNSATTRGGGIAVADSGHGHGEPGNVTLTNSTLSGNYASTGGGIYSEGGTVTLTNSTLSGNTAGQDGGGILTTFPSSIALTNSTVSGNSATAEGGGIQVFSYEQITLNNSIVAGNMQAGNDLFSFRGVSGSHNLIGAVANLDLGPLADNGGPTQTMLPQAGSAAIDAGACHNPSASPADGIPTTDQRGVARPQGAGCDIGAVQLAQFPLTVSVTGQGSVSAAASPAPTSGGITNCTSSGGSACAARYTETNPPAAAQLTATFAAGYYFSTWSGDCSGTTATTTVTMDQARSCTATFAAETMTASGNPNPSVWNQLVTLNATFSGAGSTAGDTITFSEGASPVCTATMTAAGTASCATSALAVGSHTISAKFAGNSLNGADVVNFSQLVNKANQAITGFAPTSVTYSPNGTFTATANGGASNNAVTFTSTTPGVCTTGGSHGATVTIVSAGSCGLTANQAGNGNYNAAPATPFSVAIGKAAAAITNFAATPANPTFSVGGTFTLSATSSGSTAAIVYASTAPAVCTVSGNTVTILAAGTCSLTANQAGDANYEAATQVTLDVPIAQATGAITGFAATPANPTFSVGGSFTLSAASSGSTALIVYASTTPAVCTVSGNTVTILAAGTCSLTANQAGDANYEAATQVTLDVPIAQASQTITLDSPGDLMLQHAPVSLDPTASSGLPVTLVSNTPSVCSVAGSGPYSVSFHNIGECTLTASQAGNGNYVAAPPVTIRFGLSVPNVPVPTLNRWAALLLGLLLGGAALGWRRRLLERGHLARRQ